MNKNLKKELLNIPNVLTYIRIVLIPVVIVLMYRNTKKSLFFAAAVYSIAAVTDFFDGLLARKLNQISELGTFLDPVADKLMVCAALILLTNHHQLWSITIPSIIIISREILVSALREWMGEIGKRANISVSWIGKSKTFMQMFAILFLLYDQILFGISSFNIGLVLLFVATVLTLWSGFNYLTAGLKTFDS